MGLGTMLLVVTPTFTGGVALRFASTRSLMHLRPHGRTRLLLGATLAITIIAALVALPSLTMELLMAANGRIPDLRHTSSLVMFLISWPVLAVGWICIFTLSRSMLATAVMGLLPITVITVGKVLAPVIPGPAWVFVPGLACWGAFWVWYLRTDFVTRPKFPLSGGADLSDMPIGRLLARLDPARGTFSRPQAMLQYLFGCTSLRFFVLTGAVVALALGVVQLFTVGSLVRRTDQMLMMMPFFAFLTVSIGYTTARRVRFLWLRADLDRAGLFGTAERLGLGVAMTTWSVGCAAIMVCAFID
jgi:hypothetical protein